MKEHQQEHKHQRYYIFQHTNGVDVLYRTSTGDWTPNFYEANLWADYDFAKKKATDLFKSAKSHSSYRNERYVIGRVDVAVDGYYLMEVAG